MEKQRFIGIGTSWIVLKTRRDVKNCLNNNDHIENVGRIYEMDVRDDGKSMGMSSTNFGHVQGI
jgi:hypothetical protein